MVAANAKVVRQENARSWPFPVHAGAADGRCPGRKLPQFADRQCGLRGIVAHRQRFLPRTEEERRAGDRIAQFHPARCRCLKSGGGVAPRAAFDRDPQSEPGCAPAQGARIDPVQPRPDDDDNPCEADGGPSVLFSPGRNGPASPPAAAYRAWFGRFHHVTEIVTDAGKTDGASSRPCRDFAAIDRIGEIALHGVGMMALNSIRLAEESGSLTSPFFHAGKPACSCSSAGKIRKSPGRHRSRWQYEASAAPGRGDIAGEALAGRLQALGSATASREKRPLHVEPVRARRRGRSIAGQ